MIQMSIIIALSMSITPIVCEWLKIPKKLRAWISLLIIIILNISNSLLFGDHHIFEAMKAGIEEGVIAVGLYSTGKNTIQYINTKKK